MADEIAAAFGHMPDHFGFKVTKTYRNNPTETIAPKNNTLFEGYVVVITGGAAGIGEYIARSYVQGKAAGVVITGRRTGPLEETKSKLEDLASELGHKVKVTTISGDAEKNETYITLREHVEKEHGGRLDALVCNAGPGNTSKGSWTPMIHDQPVEDWDSVIGVNLNGPYYAARQLIPLLLKGEGKTLVNVVSGAAHMTAGNPPISYALAKFAESRLTQNIGEVYADKGLQAFALHPGAVRTPSSLSTIPEEMLAILTDDINLCGNWCVWLSKHRPQWLSGRYLAVNWDVDELSEIKDKVVEQELFKFKMAVL